MKLYKYRVFNTYSLTSLVSKEIWVSKPGDFNDPFDCPATWLSVSVPVKVVKNPELRDARMSHLRRSAAHGRIPWDDLECYDSENTEYKTVTRTENLTGEQLKTINDMGIYSLSETAVDILMWTHYADEHKGFCIEYDASEKPKGEFELVTVDYDAINSLMISGDTNVDQLRREVSRLKANKWKYEREHRLICKNGNKAYPEPYPISSIIFGLRMPDSQKETIRRIVCDRLGIRFKKAAMGAQIYELQIQDIG